MQNLVNPRFIKIETGGKVVRIPVGNDMTLNRMDRILTVGKGYLQQYVYVELVIAECFLQSIEESISKKKCFKFGVKKLWNECKVSLRKTICNFDMYVPNAEFTNEYAMTYYDNVKGDIYKLRDKMASKFQKYGYGEKSGLYSNATVAYNLLIMCADIYDALMYRLNELLGVNIHDVYLEFCPVLAIDKSYGFMRAVMGDDFDRLLDCKITKDMVDCYDRIRKGIFSEKIMDEAAENATESLCDGERELMCRTLDYTDVLQPDFPIELVKKKKVG